jgi:Domain of unknown function (DUF4129)
MNAASPPVTDRPPSSPRLAQWLAWVTALALILVEVSWFVPLYLGLAEVGFSRSLFAATVVFMLVLLVAYGVQYGLNALHLLPNMQRLLLVGVYFISLILTSQFMLPPVGEPLLVQLVNLRPAAVLIVAATFWLWWRGANLARDTIDTHTVWRHFQQGLLMLAVGNIYLHMVLQISTGFGPILLFLFASLMAMAMTRVSGIAEFYGKAQKGLGRRWFFFTLGVLTLVLGVSAIVTSLLTGQFSSLLDQIGLVIEWLLVPVAFIASLFAYILFYIGVFIGTLLTPLLPKIQGEFQLPTPLPNDLLGTQTPNQPAPTIFDSPAFATLETVLFWLIVVILVALLFGVVGRRYLRRRRADYDEPEAMLEDRDLLSLMRQRLAERARQIADLLNPGRFSRSQRAKAATRIRQIYADFLDLCQDLGHPRPQPETPFEFLASLQGQIFQGAWPELNLITQAYVEVRYGELPEDQGEMDAIEAAWKRLSLEGERLKKELE